MSSSLRSKRARVFMALGILIMLLWVFTPYYFLLASSFVQAGTIVYGFTIPPFLTLDNFKEVFGGVQAIWPFLINSIVVSGGVTLLSLIFGVPAGYGLSRLRQFSIARGMYLSFFILRMLPPMAFVIPYYLFFARTGLLDHREGLIMALLPFGLPFTIWTIKAFFDNIPPTIDESAQLEGANPFQTFVLISLPIVAQGIAATALLNFLLAYVDYMFAATLARNTAMTFSVYVVSFQNDYVVYVSAMMAAAMVGTLPMIAVYFYAQRFMQRMAIIGVL